MKTLFYLSAVLAGMSGVLCISGCNHNPVIDDYTFVVTGDNRVAAEDTVGDPSTTNTYQLKRMFKEVSELNPLPKMLIFNGDLVMGYTDEDTLKLAHELREWIKIYKESPLPAKGVRLIVFTGNHETSEKIGSGKIAYPPDERTFVREMKDYIAGDDGPHYTGLRPGTDSLMTDESKLTYSFDFGGDHYVIFNTDAVDRESRIPYHWLDKDLKKAREEGARHIFLFGHKPAWANRFDDESGLNDFPANRDSAWSIMEKYNADIYFCSHFHLWDTVHPRVFGGKTWQVVCGNAGAPCPKAWTNPYYGFTIVRVYSKIDITSMGRDLDDATYTKPREDKPTTVRAKFTIGN
jgi:hypothetical protein